MSSFRARRLRVTLILGGGNSVFPGTNSNTLVLDDLRMSVSVQAAARQDSQADLRIYGMRFEDMNALTVAWANPPVVLNHYVIIDAWTGKTWSQIFKGTMTEAQPDFSDQPDVAFVITAQTGYFQRINPSPPTPYEKPVEIAVAVRDLATKMGFAFIDGGAKGVLTDQYLWGTYYDQMAQACRAANTDFYLLGDTLVITAAGRPRNEAPAVKLTRDTGLIGYPQYERAGLAVRAIFDPAFTCAVPLEIVSDTPSATGRWYPYAFQHLLDARMPGGSWQTQMTCLRVLA